MIILGCPGLILTTHESLVSLDSRQYPSTLDVCPRSSPLARNGIYKKKMCHEIVFASHFY